MRKVMQIKLNDLTTKFESVYSKKQCDSFEAEWRLFFHQLTSDEKIIAIDAFFKTVRKNIHALTQVTLQLVENGNEDERENAINRMQDLTLHPLFAKSCLAVS